MTSTLGYDIECLAVQNRMTVFQQEPTKQWWEKVCSCLAKIFYPETSNGNPQKYFSAPSKLSKYLQRTASREWALHGKEAVGYWSICDWEQLSQSFFKEKANKWEYIEWEKLAWNIHLLPSPWYGLWTESVMLTYYFNIANICSLTIISIRANSTIC